MTIFPSWKNSRESKDARVTRAMATGVDTHEDMIVLCYLLQILWHLRSLRRIAN